MLGLLVLLLFFSFILLYKLYKKYINILFKLIDYEIHRFSHAHTLFRRNIEPVELVRKASKTGVEAIAITDHDNFRAYSVAKNEAEKLGLQLVFGSEVTAEKYHILGLGAKLNNPEFIRFLEYSRKLQMNNTRRTVANLQKVGLDVNFEEVENYTPVGARVGCFNVSLYLANNEKFKDFFFKKELF
jgi:predicted metal-dependent phosphoesterase TrpH